MRRLPFLCVGLAAALLSTSASAQIVTYRGSFDSSASTKTMPSVEDAARALVFAKAPAPAALSLGAARSSALRGGFTIVRLPQMHQGVPVALRGATVTFDAAGDPRALSLQLADDLPADVTPVLGAAAAAAIASTAAGVHADASRATLAVWPLAGSARLAWIVYPEPTALLAYAPLIVIDAVTGEQLLAYNARVAVDQAQVYPTNPVKSPELVQVALPVGPADTTLQGELIHSSNCIDMKSVKKVLNFDVHTCDLLQTVVRDVNGDFLVPPGGDTEGEDPFSEVSMYYHANRAYALFRSFQPDFVVQNSPLETVSNLRLPAGYQTFDLVKMANPDLPLQPFQNAFFAPSNPIFSQVFGLQGAAMWFGQGPKRDYSYDGDVIYHEFTHAVVSATVKLVGFAHADEYGLSQAPGGMNEGLADYFSSAIAGDPDVGEYAVEDIGGVKAIRSLTNPDRCPDDLGGEVHQDATLFSGGLWDVRATLSAADATLLDEAVFAAMNAAPTGDLGYEDMAELILDAVSDSKLGAATAEALKDAFTKRGVLPKCTRILEYQGTALKGPTKLGFLWIAPGLQAANLGKDATYAPGIVQVHSPLSENTGTLTVTFTGKASPAGGTDILGPQGTPFDLQVLVRFGADPITFTYGPLTPAEGVVLVKPTKQKNGGTGFSATVDVPPGALEAHIMIANAGEQDGAYSAIALSTTAAPPIDEQPPVENPPPVDPKPKAKNAAEPAEDSGCGCAVPGAGASSTGAALALVALGVASRRRRRRGLRTDR